MWIFYSAIRAVFDLKRVCRSCGGRQIVPLRLKNKSVDCTRCGKKLPATPNQL